MENERFNRQRLLFGEDGQKAIEKTKVGIVGLGGIGSQIVQSLTYLGVQSFVLIDDDVVEESNLNRLVGATEKDAEQAVFKTVVSKRLILATHSLSEVESYSENLRSSAAINALKTCNVVFGCVDNDAARLILSEFTAAYLIPLIDSATEILPNSTSGTFGGRVILTQPGKFCLSCANAIDMDIARQELESPEAKEVRHAHGYGLGEMEKSPAVVSLNGVIANLAVTEFMMLITKIREPNKYLNYYGERSLQGGNVMTNRIPRSNEDCFTCHYLYGQKEKANIHRYVKTV